MPHTLPQLDYSYDALEPHIDARTMEIHHSKHHQAYVDKLNQALENYPELQEKPVEDLLKNLDQIPEPVRTAVKNNGGGHYNHSLFWEVMSKTPQPISGLLKTKIEEKWSSIENFKDTFTQAAISTFGSGWTWLCIKNNELEIISTSNQDTPLAEGSTPIFLIDVWEHAYYLKYQNRRPDYIKAWLDHALCGEKIALDKI